MPADDEMRHETRSIAECEATPGTPDVATITWGKHGLMVTEHPTKECPDYLKQWASLFDDVKRAHDSNGEGIYEID
ncbi:hypothetical protein ACU635_59040 [[Actinomadura] parvosata]|uniref:hypothetical protein n=1 Tax=[Actinomadura] parvosata TaxID=1955412 RepID=UPI00406C469A